MGVYRLATGALRLLPPEAAHNISLRTLSWGLGPRQRQPDDPVLASRVWGFEFANPVGLAAGYDKHAEAMGAALRWGFGFIEVGSVTPEPQQGNPAPRLFRLAEDRAVINRMGFNSAGAASVRRRLAAFRARDGAAGPVGVNLGKNRNSTEAASDYAKGAAALADVADYLVINVSSPNTPGLRALQGRQPLQALIGAVREALPAAPPPLVLKIAPDLTDEDKEDIAAVAEEQGLDGLIVGNTTISRPAGLRGRYRDEAGGLSGQPLAPLALAVLRDMYRLTGGRLPLVACGGIASGADAYARIRAGASLVQLYTALIYEGPGLVARIKRDLAAALKADGFARLADAIGVGVGAGAGPGAPPAASSR